MWVATLVWYRNVLAISCEMTLSVEDIALSGNMHMRIQLMHGNVYRMVNSCFKWKTVSLEMLKLIIYGFWENMFEMFILLIYDIL